MMMAGLTTLPLFICCGSLLLLWTLYSRRRKVPPGFRAVPGPKGLPIIGNTHQYPLHQPQKALKKWADEYGELFHIQLGWNDWVYVNSPEAVKEIFDKQSAHTSSRPPSPVSSDLISGGMRFLLMPYGQQWRTLRSITHKLLSPKESDNFRPSQEFEAKQLVYDFLTSNKDEKEFYMHVRRYTTSVVMTSTYGKRVPTYENQDVREIYALMAEFSEGAAPGAFLAETIPPLAKIPIPLQWWRSKALSYLDHQKIIWLRNWNILKRQMEEGKAPDCFVKQCIESSFEKHGVSELQAAFLAGSMIEAGSETTSSALNSAILYLAATPHARRAAHEELARVIGDSRSPTYDDEPSLPYVRACVKEILRIRPVTNIGTPHYTTADITYKDYHIPSNTIVSINQYAIHFDPERYPDPYTFKPERYLHHPLKAGAYAAHPDPYTRDHFDFGAGRRICSGMHLAENSLFITLAKILWAFDILPPLDESGKETTMDTSDDAYEDGANTLPKEFRVRFVPRNAEVEKTIRTEWADAKKDGYWLGNVKVDADGMVIKH